MTTIAVRRPTDLWSGLDAVEAGWGPCVVTIGMFDGVHRGHAQLVERAAEVAKDRGLPAVMVTFDPHPARVTGPGRDTATLSTPRRRAELAGDLGVNAVLVLPFTTKTARTPPEQFVEQVLVDRLRAQAVVVGSNFRFGSDGSGDVDLLHRLGRTHGFTAVSVDLLHLTRTRCSSTHIRNCLANGDIAAANQALGRPHRVEGQLLGRVLHVPPDTAMPGDGHFRGILTTVDHGPQHVNIMVNHHTAIIMNGSAPSSNYATSTLDFVANGNAIRHR